MTANGGTIAPLTWGPRLKVPRLNLVGVSKRFGGVQALRGAMLTLAAGEVHALVGENGAGKSTLIKIVTGAIAADAGTLEMDGQPIAANSPRMARRLRVAAIYQQPALFGDLTVAENIAFALEEPRALGTINWRGRRQVAGELLKRLGADISVDAEVRELGMAQQQLVEIAKALGSQARIVILDEPTAALGAAETERLFAAVRQMRAAGVGLLYVSHRLEELPQIADRVTVLRDGANVASGAMAEFPRARLIQAMVGRASLTSLGATAAPADNVVLDVQNLTCAAEGVRGVSLRVRGGEIVGLFGLVGAGRTQLARVLFGLAPADDGVIQVDGRAVKVRAPQDALLHGIAYLPEDRRRCGVIAELDVIQNISLASLGRVSHGGWIDARREQALASPLMSAVQLKAASPYAPVQVLSGGNQQKVALARWLATRPRVLILDEPTQGVDVGAKAEIHDLIRRLAASGRAVLLISSELEELRTICHRLHVLRGGRIVGETPPAAAPDEIMELAFGGAVHESAA